MKTKNSTVFSLLLLVTITSSLFAQEKTESFKVLGNCNMCKKRIENSLKIEPVSSAVWNVGSKIMTVTYDASKISNNDLQKKIAEVGHDTEKFEAPKDVFNKLPKCCLYERSKSATITKEGSH